MSAGPLAHTLAKPDTPNDKSFLVLFFKKEHAVFPSARPARKPREP
jgi:hypothetical protein